MGVSIELRIGNFNKIVEELTNKIGKNDIEMLEKILLQFGERIDDNYLLLNNEYWDEFNSYYGIAELIDRYYGIKNSFDVFLYNMKEANANWNVYDASRELGIDLPDSDEY